VLTVLFQFVEAATAICENLMLVGYWADFIDPRSGKPYYHREVTQKPFDHDERYQRLGYQLMAEGTCNVSPHLTLTLFNSNCIHFRY